MKAYHEQRSYDNTLSLNINKMDGLSFLAHWHDEIELLYIQQGVQRLGVGNQMITVSAGQIVLIAPWQIHYYDSNDHAKGYLLLFRPEILQNFLINNSGFWSFPMDSTVADTINKLMADLYDEMTNRSEYYDLAATGLLRLLLTRLYRPDISKRFECIKTGRTADMMVMHDIISYIEEHYREDISRDRLAQQFTFSAAHFSRYFKKTTGLSFVEYVTRLRIEASQKELIKPELSITQIAYDSGFESVRTFNRCFLKYTGQTPTEMRQNLL